MFIENKLPKEIKISFFISIILIIVLIDQSTKLWVHFNMELGYSGQISVLGDFFKLYYVLNPGMAFGINFESEYSKLLLTLLRCTVSLGMIVLLVHWYRNNKSFKKILALSFLIGGAIGNVIDSIFYGVFLENNALEGAFTPWFHGQVIDFLYFPLFEGTIPEWVPFEGGNPFLFLSAIFNFSDTFIYLGLNLLTIEYIFLEVYETIISTIILTIFYILLESIFFV